MPDRVELAGIKHLFPDRDVNLIPDLSKGDTDVYEIGIEGVHTFEVLNALSLAANAYCNICPAREMNAKQPTSGCTGMQESNRAKLYVPKIFGLSGQSLDVQLGQTQCHVEDYELRITHARVKRQKRERELGQ